MTAIDQEGQIVDFQINSVVYNNFPLEGVSAFEKFLIQPSEIDKINSVFVQPMGYDSVFFSFTQKKLIWIIGQSGIGKRALALRLALDTSIEKIYSVSRSMEWEKLSNANIENAVFILPDALGLMFFESKNLENELIFLEKLLALGNKLIITCSDDIYAETVKEVPYLDEWNSKYAKFSVNTDSYKDKASIFRRTAKFAYSIGAINEEQQKWALQIVNSSEKGNLTLKDDTKGKALIQRLLKQVWLPIDIDRFIFVSLPNAQQSNDLLDLLQKDADIDSRIHSWFLSMDESVRCFILTLILFAGYPNEYLWKKHNEIVRVLRHFNPTLQIPPLGILRSKSSPYVTQTGNIDFIDSRAYKAIVKEIAKNYREYFTELLALYKEWTIPDLPETIDKETRSSRLAATEITRNSIARVVGEIGKQSIDDIKEILSMWASHSLGTIGKTAGIALQETISDPLSVHDVLVLLQEWAVDESRYRRWASASALWRISSVDSRFDLSNFTLSLLQKLAKDHDDYVVSSAAHALGKLVRYVDIDRILPTLTVLAKEGERFTRQQIAQATDEIARIDKDKAVSLLDTWIVSEDVSACWTAMYALLVSLNIDNFSKQIKLSKVIDLPKASLIMSDVLLLSLNNSDERRKEKAWSTLVRFAEDMTHNKRQMLLSALADEDQSYPQTQELRMIFFSSENPSIKTIPTEVDIEIQKRIVKNYQIKILDLLEDPDVFFEELHKESLSNNSMFWEAFDDLVSSEVNNRRTNVILSLGTANQWKIPERQNLHIFLETSLYESVKTLPLAVDEFILDNKIEKMLSPFMGLLSINIVSFIKKIAHLSLKKQNR